MTTYKLLYLRFLQAQKDFPRLKFSDMDAPEFNLIDLSESGNREENQRAEAIREFNRSYEFEPEPLKDSTSEFLRYVRGGTKEGIDRWIKVLERDFPGYIIC